MSHATTDPARSVPFSDTSPSDSTENVVTPAFFAKMPFGDNHSPLFASVWIVIAPLGPKEKLPRIFFSDVSRALLMMLMKSFVELFESIRTAPFLFLIVTEEKSAFPSKSILAGAVSNVSAPSHNPCLTLTSKRLGPAPTMMRSFCVVPPTVLTGSTTGLYSICVSKLEMAVIY